MSAGTVWDIEIAEPAAPSLARAWPGRVANVLPAIKLSVLVAVAVALRAPGLMAVAFGLGTMLTLFASGAYEPRLRMTVLDALPERLGAVAVGVVVATFVRIYAEGAAAPGAGMLGALLGCGVVALVLLRGVAVVAARAAWRESGGEPALVVGAGRVAEEVARHLREDRACGLRPVAVVADPADVTAAIARHGAHHVVVGFSEQPDARLADAARAAERLGARVWVVPRMFDLLNHRATYHAVGGLPVLGLRSVARDDWRYVVKHALDRLAAAVLLVAVAPLLAACALAVRLDSPGPVLFRQRRVGRDGRVFEILKFRSMRPSAPSTTGFAPPSHTAPGGVEGDDRRTRVGMLLRRTSLDELPQLVNVLRGEMSLVGPRPERPEFVTRFGDVARYDERHRVRAGMTGWAQVHGLRGKTSIADRIAYDNHYIEHFSLWLDVKTLALTLLAVLRSAE